MTDCILASLSIIAAGIFVAYWIVRGLIGLTFMILTRSVFLGR